MTRSLDFTACIKQDTCPVKDCWRKLTKEEKDWLEKTPNRMYYADFSNECDKLKKKSRMTCKQYCSVWNDIDNDCELYGEHHLTPRTCPHYNLEILEKMKMNEKFNKFIEENYDTSQSPRNGSQKGDLTSQWKKGELPEGHYYVKDGENMIAEYLDGYFYNNGEPMTSFTGGVDEILAPVPSYDEWKAKLEQNAQLKEQISKCYLDAINRGTANAVKAVKEFGMPERIKELAEQNAQLKELLKECMRQFEEVELCRYDVADTDQEDWFKISTEQADIANKMLAKIDELLK